MTQVLPRATTTGRLLTPRFVAVGLAALAYFTGDGILAAVLPRYVTGPLGAGTVAVGVVVGAFSVSAFVLRPLAGGMGDRWGRKPLLVAGAGVFSVSVLAYPIAPGPAVLALLRLLTGAGEALFFVGAVSAFLDLAPPARRGEAMSLASLALYLGLGAGPALGEVTLARLGFPATWALAAAAGVAAAAIAARTPETRPPLPPERPRQRLVHPAGLLPGLVLLASILGMAGFLAFVPLHAPAVGMGGAGLPLAVFSGVVVAIRSLGARLPDRLGAARSTQLALLLSAVGSALIGAWPVRSGLLGGAVVLGVGVGLLTPAVFALAVEGAAAEERGVVIGTVSAFLDIALGVGPVSLGLVAAQLGLSATFLTSAAVAAVGLVAVVVLRVGRPAATG